jgi:hypothetical protein
MLANYFFLRLIGFCGFSGLLFVTIAFVTAGLVIGAFGFGGGFLGTGLSAMRMPFKKIDHD